MFGFGKKKKGISEQPVPAEILQNIKNCAGDADRLVGITVAQSTPADIMEAINRYVADWQRGKRPPAGVTDPDDSQYTLGALWGEQLVAQFGWQWVNVTFHEHGDSQAFGVATPDRSLVVYPFHFLLGCLRDPGVPVTISLSFNMLAAGSIPALPAKGYENLMDGVHHIIPPA